MTATITYTIPGARTLDQLSEPTVDGHADENARENCVAASLAEALRILIGNQVYDGDQLKDAVYGQGYTGTMSAHAYIAYCASKGVTLAAETSPTQAGLIALLHRAISAGHPCLVTMPSQWATAPADPRHPAGYTHVGLAVGIGPDALRVMNPWHGFMQDESDDWWAARLCYGEVWTLQKKVSATTVTPPTATAPAPAHIIPAGWHDDAATATLTAPNGIPVVRGMRERVLGWPGGWPAWDTPLEPEHDRAQLELFNPALGGGVQQVFRTSVLEWNAEHGVLLMPVGAELLATRAALSTAQAALTVAQSQIAYLHTQLAEAQSALANAQAQLQAQAQAAAAQVSAAQAQAGDELTRAAAHAFAQSFASALATALAAGADAVAAPPAAGDAAAAPATTA